MKTPALVLGIIFTISFIVLACLISRMVNFAGAGDNFWSVGIVQCTTLCLVVSLFFWRALFLKFSKKRK